MNGLLISKLAARLGLSVKVLFAVAVLTLGLGAPALAHTRSESHSDWQINGSHIEATIAIPAMRTSSRTERSESAASTDPVMTTNDFLRTVWRYSRLKTTKSFLMASTKSPPRPAR